MPICAASWARRATTSFERLLAFTDLKRFTGRLAGRLSGGMKQKLGLACAMLRSPRLLLLDEPSVGVDPISRRELWRMVDELTGEGVGVVWSTAYLDEAENCAEVLVLNAGKLLFQGDPKAMTEHIQHRAFLVRGVAGERRMLAHPRARAGLKSSTASSREKRCGSSWRKGLRRPTPAQLGAPGASIAAAKPRFEDAFVALLGGQPKRTQASRRRRAPSMARAMPSRPPA